MSNSNNLIFIYEIALFTTTVGSLVNAWFKHAEIKPGIHMHEVTNK